MKRRWSRTSTAAVVVALVALAAFYLLVPLAGIDANALAAGGSALAAIAALLAARQSSEAARDSVRALSYATKPEVWIETMPGGGRAIVLRNRASYTAVGVHLEYLPRDGRRKQNHVGRLAGDGAQGQTPRPTFLNLDPFGYPVGDGVDQLLVTFASSYGPVKWRQSYDFMDENDWWILTDETEV